MATNKRYYWIKLKEEFFTDKRIKRLRRISGGDTYTIIYLKLLLLSLKDEGKLYYDGVESDFIKELALTIDETDDDVMVTVNYLINQGLLEVVTENDTAAKAASGSVEVLATPVMIAWMEEASLHLAQKGLEEGLTTVGTEVNIKHLKGTLVGKTVKVLSTLKEIDRKRLVFDVEVIEDGVAVGTGSHTRFIIDTAKFYEKLKNTK